MREGHPSVEIGPVAPIFRPTLFRAGEMPGELLVGDPGPGRGAHQQQEEMVRALQIKSGPGGVVHLHARPCEPIDGLLQLVGQLIVLRTAGARQHHRDLVVFERTLGRRWQRKAPPLRVQACGTGEHLQRHGQIVGTAGERAADGHIGRRIDAREADDPALGTMPYVGLWPKTPQ